MKRLLLLVLLSLNIIVVGNNGIYLPNKEVIDELILIRNTYNWVQWKSTKSDMLNRQLKLVNTLKDSIMYEDYLIKIDSGGDS